MALLLCSYSIAVDAVDKTPPKCQTACAAVYEPICGGPPGATATSSVKPVTFGSACVLGKFNCESDKSESHPHISLAPADNDRDCQLRCIFSLPPQTSWNCTRANARAKRPFVCRKQQTDNNDRCFFLLSVIRLQ